MPKLLMSLYWFVLLGILTVPALADQGPLQVKNRFPLHLLFLTPRPATPETPPAGVLDVTSAVDYTCIYFNHGNSNWDVLIDMEMTTLDWSLSYGLTSNTALQLELPIVSMNAGFLDGFLASYHNALGVPNYGREERPENDFAYHVSKGGELWLEGESGGVDVADVTLSVQVQLLRKTSDNPWAGAIVGSLKIPTGNTDKGLGSGRFDYGMYLSAGRFRRPWSLFLMTGLAINHNPETQGAEVETRPSYSLFTGVAYDYSDQTTYVIQINGYTSPIEETGIDELDSSALELSLGFHYKLEKSWAVEFAFCEDLTRAAPDFTLRLGLIRNFYLK